MIDEYDCELNYGQMFFILASFIPAVLCLPCWMVAKFVYEPYVNQVKNEEDEPWPFEKMYPLSEATNTRDMTKSFEEDIILTNTPDGNVYMRYSKEEEGFEYWADNTIAYKYLESVARNYVTTFACKDIYIDRLVLLRDKLENLKKDIKKNKEMAELDTKHDSDEEKDENDVFVNLKSYNKKTNDDDKKMKITKSDIVCDKANKYINKGKLEEAKFLKKEKKELPSSSGLSFSSWKLWRSKNKED